jgi:hypothetical protein
MIFSLFLFKCLGPVVRLIGKQGVWPWDQGLFIYLFFKGFGGGEIDWYLFVGSHFIFFFSCILEIWSICHHNSNFPCYGAMEFQSLLTWQAQKNKELKKSRGDNKGGTHTHT